LNGRKKTSCKGPSPTSVTSCTIGKIHTYWPEEFRKNLKLSSDIVLDMFQKINPIEHADKHLRDQ
jgi:hypothetical protein